MNKKDLLQLVDHLDLPIDEYYLLSSASLLLHGLREEVNDLDLCVSTELFETMKNKFNINLSSKNDCGFYRVSEIIEVVVNKKEDFNRKFKDGYPVEPLKNILEFKKKRNADKDQADIRNIQTYLIEHSTKNTSDGMSIIEIYNRYGIPKGLQEHMLRVAACAAYILDHWHGPIIQKESLLKVLLLHDMGNLVKIIEKYDDKKFEKNRDKYFALYGNDDHAVSEAIGKELGLTAEELQVMGSKGFMNNEWTMKSDSYSTKIGAYCDQRVAPNGVYSLRDRMVEGKLRYKDRPGTSFNNPSTDYMIACAEEIENQIMKYCNIVPSAINDTSISSYMENLRNFKII